MMSKRKSCLLYVVLHGGCVGIQFDRVLKFVLRRGDAVCDTIFKFQLQISKFSYQDILD